MLIKFSKFTNILYKIHQPLDRKKIYSTCRLRDKHKTRINEVTQRWAAKNNFCTGGDTYCVKKKHFFFYVTENIGIMYFKHAY